MIATQRVSAARSSAEQRVRHANHGWRVANEIVLGRQHAVREQRREIARERLGVLLALDDGDEARVELRLLLVTAKPGSSSIVSAMRQSRYAFVITTASASRQDGNRQRERARNARQNAALISEIVVGRADCSARFGHHEGSRRARRFGVRMARDDNTGLS